MDFQAPVIRSLSKVNLESFLGFMERMRTDPGVIADLEVERLAPYIRAFSAQLKKDVAEMGLPASDPQAARLLELSEPDSLRRLFSASARFNHNTILSEMSIVPENAFTNPDIEGGGTQFAGKSSYDGSSFTLGFIQVFENADKKSSVSLPVFAFDTVMMNFLSMYAPEKLLGAFQTIMTAGNHDMLHHYTSQIINPNITVASVRNSDTQLVSDRLNKWDQDSFSNGSDTLFTSYESWLMMNHARIRKLMEDGPEGDALRSAVNVFFDELKRISGEITALEGEYRSHKVADYFGTLACFAMMRFMPLDHPLINHAIAQLKEADPDTAAITGKAAEIHRKIMDGDLQNYTGQAIENYRAKGFNLIPPRELEYEDLKRLQLLALSPWTANLMSPAIKTTGLGMTQDKVARVNREMIDASAHAAWFSPKDGLQRIVRRDGTQLEVHFKNGVPHCDDGPAVTLIRHGYPKVEYWCKNGVIHRDDGAAIIETSNGVTSLERFLLNGKYGRKDGGPTVITESGLRGRLEEWLNEKGERDRKDGPAFIHHSPDGAYTEQYYLDGKNGREEDLPSVTKISPNGTRVESWMKDGELHRAEGPAHIETHASGMRVEIFYLKGALHRIGLPALRATRDGEVLEESWKEYGIGTRSDGPAYFKKYSDGSYYESWILHGGMHRTGGPAEIYIDAHGVRTETWFHHKERHRTDGPALIETGTDGTVVSTWYNYDQIHRADGPAVSITKNGQLLKEIWYENGEAVRVRDYEAERALKISPPPRGMTSGMN